MGPGRPASHAGPRLRPLRRAASRTAPVHREPAAVGDRARGVVPGALGPAPWPRWSSAARGWRRALGFGGHPARHALGPAAAATRGIAALHGDGARARPRIPVAR